MRAIFVSIITISIISLIACGRQEQGSDNVRQTTQNRQLEKQRLDNVRIFSYPSGYQAFESFEDLVELFSSGMGGELSFGVAEDASKWNAAFATAYSVKTVLETVLDEKGRKEMEAYGQICERGRVMRTAGGASFSRWTWGAAPECSPDVINALNDNYFDGSVSINRVSERQIATSFGGHSSPDTSGFFFHNGERYELDGAHAFKGDIEYSLTENGELITHDIRIHHLVTYIVSKEPGQKPEPFDNPVTYENVRYEVDESGRVSSEYIRKWSENVWSDGEKAHFTLSVNAHYPYGDMSMGNYIFDLKVRDYPKYNVKAKIELLEGGYKLEFSRNGKTEQGKFNY